MLKVAVGALAAACVLTACSKRSETADTATIPGIDTARTVVSVPITDSVPGAVALKNDSARARAHDSAKAGQTVKARHHSKRRS
ncbi:MAG TPA: hypothetical protein VFT29_07185 [Gemmatimonadaceae bacterium]|nr:hypothetical protein [Gemmatimonadaceae bacterium]